MSDKDLAPSASDGDGVTRRRIVVVGVLLCGMILMAAIAVWWRSPEGNDPKRLALRGDPPAAVPLGDADATNSRAETSRLESELPGDPAKVDGSPEEATVDEPLTMAREQLQEVQRLGAAHPNDQNAVYLLGLILHEQGNIDEAIATWRRCLELNPRRSDLYDSLGRAYSRKGDLAQAVEMYRRALEFQPNALETRARLAESLLQQGDLPEVLAVLDTDLGTNPNVRLVLGQALQQMEEHEKARQQFQEAVAIQPDLAQAYYGLAVSCSALGQNEEAQANQEKFLELENLRQQAGRDPLRTYDAAGASRSRLAESLSDVGRVYQSLQNPEEAERLWLRAAAASPENVRCRDYLAALYQEQKKFTESLRYRLELTRLEPERAIHYFHVGNMNLILKRFDAAADAYRKVVQLEPNRPDGYRALAQCYLLADENLDQAIEFARTALRLSPEAPVYAILGRLYAKNGDREGALNAMQQAVHLDPGNPEYRRIYESLQRKR